MSSGGRSSPAAWGTQMRASLRSDSLISVVFDCQGALSGMAVGWNWTNDGLAR